MYHRLKKLQELLKKILEWKLYIFLKWCIRKKFRKIDSFIFKWLKFKTAKTQLLALSLLDNNHLPFIESSNFFFKMYNPSYEFSRPLHTPSFCEAKHVASYFKIAFSWPKSDEIVLLYIYYKKQTKNNRSTVYMPFFEP